MDIGPMQHRAALVFERETKKEIWKRNGLCQSVQAGLMFFFLFVNPSLPKGDTNLQDMTIVRGYAV